MHLPPSTDTTCPVMYPAAGRHKNATRLATSSGSPTRPAGVLDNTELKEIIYVLEKDTLQKL